MWCLETINQVNLELAKNGKTAQEAYESVGIRVLSNTSRNLIVPSNDEDVDEPQIRE